MSSCGSAELTGICVDDNGCDSFVWPVCGCDGLTYDNSCEASRAGAGIAHAGGCEPPPPTCGGQTCAADEFCWLDDSVNSCGGSDHAGVCTSSSTVCDDFVFEVCGCDGQTYDNGCFASKAGVGIAHTGACGS